MLITTFTTYAEVRAVCGVSSKEVSDSLLQLSIYANELELALDSVTLPDDAPGPGALKTVFAALPIEAERTDKEQQLYNLTRLYATYSVAEIVARTLSTMIPKTISDSKATLTRFSSEATFQDTIKSITAAKKNYKDAIENINATAVDVPDYLVRISPEIDRITGE